MTYCTNCLQAMKPIFLLYPQGTPTFVCATPDCVRRGLVTVFGYDRPEYPVTEGGEK